MANKVHFKATITGEAACACNMPNKDGKMLRNQRITYATIPAHLIVGPEEFRATNEEDRCAHCAEQFTDRMNARRARSGKPAYKNAFTKELA